MRKNDMPYFLLGGLNFTYPMKYFHSEQIVEGKRNFLHGRTRQSADRAKFNVRGENITSILYIFLLKLGAKANGPNCLTWKQ